eukprot:gene25700-31037_t
MKICFSQRLQRLLFTLMKTISADLQLKADVMIHLVNFLEEMDTNSDLWMCCCESGFAISFLQHLLPVVEEENKFAIGTFIKQKINELYTGIIQHGNENEIKAKFLLLQELLYMVAISHDFDWSLHAYEIVLAAKGVLSLFVPYSSPEACGVAMKCLLVFSTVLTQVLSGNSSTPLEPSLVQGIVDVCTESARIVLSCEQKVSAATLNKNALVVLSKASLAVPGSASYISQHLVKFFEESFPAQTRISLKQFLLRTDGNRGTLDCLDVIDATVCKEVQEVLDVYISLLNETNRYENGKRQERKSDVTVGMTVAKFCMQIFAMDVNPVSANSIDGAAEHNLSPTEVLQVIHDFMQRLVMTLFHDYVALSHQGACQSFLHHAFDSILLSFDSSYGHPMALDDIVASLQFISLLVDYSQGVLEHADASISLAGYLEQQLQQVMRLCTSSAVMHVVSKQLIRISTIKSHLRREEGRRMLKDMTRGYVVGVANYVEKLANLLSPHDQSRSHVVIDHEEISRTSNRVNGLLSGFMEANTQLMHNTAEHDRAVYDFQSDIFDRAALVLMEIVKLFLHTCNHGILCQSERLINDVMVVLCNALCALSSVNFQIYHLTLQGEDQLAAHGVNLARNVSTFRIWTYLLLLKLHFDHAAESTATLPVFQSATHSALLRTSQLHIQRISCYSFPMLFGKMIGISKAKDIIDEIHSNDMFLQASIYQQHKQYGYLSSQLRKYANFPSYGLAFHQLLYYSVMQYFESLHVSVSMDIRYIVSYSRDLSYTENKYRRAALSEIAKSVRSTWLQCIENYFVRFVHAQDQSLLLLSESIHSVQIKADMGRFIHASQDIDHMDNLSGVDSLLEPKYWPVELIRSFLIEQSKFLVQYCVDEYEEVRSFCMETFLLLLKSQHWIIASAAPALTSLVLRNVLTLEDEYHNLSNLELVRAAESRQRYQPITSSDEMSNDSHEEDAEQVVHYRKHPLLSPFLTVVAFLPKVIYPQNEDRIYAVSLKYFYFAYTFLSVHLSHSFRATSLSYFVSKTQRGNEEFEGAANVPRSIAVAIAEEMLSSYIPVYHIYQQPNDHYINAAHHLHVGFNRLDKARRKAAKSVHGEYERNKQALEDLHNSAHESALIGMQPATNTNALSMHTQQSKKLLTLMHTTKARDSNVLTAASQTPSQSNANGENELDDLLAVIGNTAYFLSSISAEQRRLVKISDIADHVTQLAGLVSLLIAKANISKVFVKKSKGVLLSILATFFDLMEKLVVYYVQEKTLIATIVSVVDSLNAQHHHQHVGQCISLLTVQLTNNVLLDIFQNAQHTIYASLIVPLVAICQRVIDQYHNAAVYSCLIHMLTQILHSLLYDKTEQRSLLNQVCGVRSKNNLVILSLLSLVCKVMKYHHLATCQQDFSTSCIHMVNVETVCILREYLAQAFICFLVDVSDTRDRSRMLVSVEPYDIPVVVQEMNYLVYIFEEMLLDNKFYTLDYPTQRYQKSPAPQQSDAGTSDVSSSVNVANEPPATNQCSAFVLFGPEAGLTYFAKLTNFKHVYKRYKEQVYTRDSYLFASDLSLLLSKSSNIVSSINDSKLLGIGVYSQNEGLLQPSDGSSKSAGRLQSLISNSAVLASLYMFLYRYVHYLHIRYLSDHSLHHNAVNDSFSNLIDKFLGIANASKIVSSVKIYKQAVKALWLYDPLAALRLHALYPAVSGQDGRKKGVSHIASFILSVVQNHALVNSTQFSVLPHPEILDVMYQHILYNPIIGGDAKLQCVRYLQFLNDVPIHFVISMLSRHHLVHIAGARESFDVCSSVAMIRYIDQILYGYTASANINKLVFFLPQLVQLLRRDKFGVIYKYLVFMALNSLNLCNELMYVLLTEGYNNVLPLSGKETKKHGKQGKYGFCLQLEGLDPLPYLCLELHREVLNLLPHHVYSYLTKQLELFHTITHVSHALMGVKNKDLHKEFIYKALKNVAIPEGTFLPTNIYHKVLSMDVHSGKAMQSAAKCPFLLMFTTTKWTGPEAHLKSLASLNATSRSVGFSLLNEKSMMIEAATPMNNGQAVGATETPTTEKVIVKNRSKGIGKRMESGMFTSPKKITGDIGDAVVRNENAAAKEEVIREGCIFKVNDDCRQDMLTIQVIRVMVECFARAQVDVYMAPYTVVSLRVGEERHLGGIIQVVGGGGVHSRDQLGKAGYKTLQQYFITHFGPVGSEGFLRAQLNFAKSLAGYSILCYLLHIKDRHNGNILFDSSGHIVHIDFGFILGISPGGNLGFEASPFKFSKEMLDLLGGVKSEAFRHYMSLTIQAYLAIREVQDEILAIVVSFADADLPCFQFRDDVLGRLKERFVGDLSESQAAKHMENLVMKAVHDWTGAAYDGVQKLQNNIYSPEWK